MGVIICQHCHNLFRHDPEKKRGFLGKTVEDGPIICDTCGRENSKMRRLICPDCGSAGSYDITAGTDTAECMRCGKKIPHLITLDCPKCGTTRAFDIDTQTAKCGNYDCDYVFRPRDEHQWLSGGYGRPSLIKCEADERFIINRKPHDFYSYASRLIVAPDAFALLVKNGQLSAHAENGQGMLLKDDKLSREAMLLAAAEDGDEFIFSMQIYTVSKRLLDRLPLGAGKIGGRIESYHANCILEVCDPEKFFVFAGRRVLKSQEIEDKDSVLRTRIHQLCRNAAADELARTDLWLDKSNMDLAEAIRGNINRKLADWGICATAFIFEDLTAVPFEQASAPSSPAGGELRGMMEEVLRAVRENQSDLKKQIDDLRGYIGRDFSDNLLSSIRFDFNSISDQLETAMNTASAERRAELAELRAALEERMDALNEQIAQRDQKFMNAISGVKGDVKSVLEEAVNCGVLAPGQTAGIDAAALDLTLTDDELRCMGFDDEEDFSDFVGDETIESRIREAVALKRPLQPDQKNCAVNTIMMGYLLEVLVLKAFRKNVYEPFIQKHYPGDWQIQSRKRFVDLNEYVNGPRYCKGNDAYGKPEYASRWYYDEDKKATACSLSGEVEVDETARKAEWWYDLLKKLARAKDLRNKSVHTNEIINGKEAEEFAEIMFRHKRKEPSLLHLLISMRDAKYIG